ncbi:MAG: M48 family metallopeptidase [Candidatus Brocadiia bacterium]
MEFNIFAIVVLAALSLDYLLNCISDALNLRAAGEELPDEMRDTYDEDRYRRSQQYLKSNTEFGLIGSTVSLAALLVFWFAGGFPYLDQFVRDMLPASWADNTIIVGLGYVAAILILRFALALPFRMYKTFIIEEKFDFNKTTPRTFMADIIKVLVLSALLGGPLFAALLAFFEYAGDLAWLYCWGVSALFSLVLQYVAPRWIMPLFNEFRPMEDDELREAIENYAEKVDFPIEGVYVMDGSKRSTKSNAFLAGFGPNKKIALFDTLIEKHTVDELVAVVAHEIGHYKKKHILKSTVLNILHLGVVFYLLSFFLRSEGLYAAFGFETDHMPLYAGFMLFGLLYSPVSLILSVLLNAFSRHNEREADRFAVETSGRADAFAHALKKLSRDNLTNLTPHPFTVFLNYGHPPVLERIRSMRREGLKGHKGRKGLR